MSQAPQGQTVQSQDWRQISVLPRPPHAYQHVLRTYAHTQCPPEVGSLNPHPYSPPGCRKIPTPWVFPYHPGNPADLDFLTDRSSLTASFCTVESRVYIGTPHPPLEPFPVPGLLKILPEITAELFLLCLTLPHCRARRATEPPGGARLHGLHQKKFR